MRSMYKSLLGRYFDRQTVGDVRYVSIENWMKRMHLENGIKRIEEYVLIDLGRLDSVPYGPYDMEGFLDGERGVSVAADSSEEHEPDVLWFGITERMVESTCLLFYGLGVKPIPVPRARVVQCSPAGWWSAEKREQVKRREEGDYAGRRFWM